MPSGKLWSVLGLCLLSVGAWGQEGDSPSPAKTFKVSISGTSVELTCPEDPDSDQIKWTKDGVEISSHNEEHLLIDNFSEMKDSGHYSCYKDDSSRHYLYLKARVCENCMEVDLMAVAGIIVADVCLTLGVLLLVYRWSKSRKARAKPVARGGGGGRPGGQNKERPPPVPNPDYEPIRKGQRDLYSGLNQRGV
ncbi:T-cell surface glycoprotein CD3 epsilon chain isoform X2 [Pipistrellus kuhlii]|uniref:T-cell surface glycoprotein CD3 epsilon chain isoform X2 n=1 Tax=Pipistrellus kuhlii TaxID=59472 RepID=UPI00174F1298|nr:T-cell surface glycoprotein CD3 epsilon chain isoform X2 [Pipistrellus kuhlii]